MLSFFKKKAAKSEEAAKKEGKKGEKDRNKKNGKSKKIKKGAIPNELHLVFYKFKKSFL